ncbi:hypothetical protein RclHR1_21550001 [Rhizophagus clarus]|uniref:Uncharacterized protein n=1 Tax=Rhizophagus clarus TaxID=94130 RepID=A0A2Z6QUT7_9GLOM|nr:hypothetical protein RclHR1_21550001 [Rhizophagus clarus]
MDDVIGRYCKFWLIETCRKQSHSENFRESQKDYSEGTFKRVCRVPTFLKFLKTSLSAHSFDFKEAIFCLTYPFIKIKTTGAKSWGHRLWKSRLINHSLVC